MSVTGGIDFYDSKAHVINSTLTVNKGKCGWRDSFVSITQLMWPIVH